MYNTVFAAGVAVVIPILIKYFLKRKYKSKIEDLFREDNRSYYQGIFWTLKNIECRKHFLYQEVCGDRCSVNYLQTILNLIKSSKTSIRLCMYHVTLKQVEQELIAARKRGVNVYIIMDYKMLKTDQSKRKMLSAGLHIKSFPREDVLLHHKFCLFDVENNGQQKMFLGSLNLTLQGFVGNFENILITNDASTINTYNAEFQRLWDAFPDYSCQLD